MLSLILLKLNFHQQLRLAGNFGLIGGTPLLLKITAEALCFFTKRKIEERLHFLLWCPFFEKNFDSLWYNLHRKVTAFNQTDGNQI